MTTHDFTTECPHCGEVHETLSSVDQANEALPEDGDVNFCFKCGKFNTFSADRTLRCLTAAEAVEVAFDFNLQSLRYSWDQNRRGL